MKNAFWSIGFGLTFSMVVILMNQKQALNKQLEKEAKRNSELIAEMQHLRNDAVKNMTLTEVFNQQKKEKLKMPTTTAQDVVISQYVNRAKDKIEALLKQSQMSHHVTIDWENFKLTYHDIETLTMEQTGVLSRCLTEVAAELDELIDVVSESGEAYVKI